MKGFVGVIEQNCIEKALLLMLIEFHKSEYKNLVLKVYMKNKNTINFYYKNLFKITNEHINKKTKEI